MKDGSITDILRQVRSLSPDDRAGKVVGVLRASQIHALPVIQNGRVVGMVTEQGLLAHLTEYASDTATVGAIMDQNPPCANIYMSIAQAADMMNVSRVDMLPVIDEFGVYRGVVVRSDLLALMLDVLRPPMVGGMATPLGVHLTTGSVSAGAGNLGLYLSGVALMLMMMAGYWTIWGAAYIADALFSTHLVVLLASPPTGRFAGIDTIHWISIPLQYLLLLVFLRISPMSGYHAAEHQVVHTIEAGEPLLPETVGRMPRAHPRCGTNLMAAALPFLVVVSRLGSDVGLLVVIIVVILGWRTIGYYLQQYFTTKPPTARQIQNGIKVGEELLAKYQRQPNRPTDGWSRIWNMGILQVGLGFATVMVVGGWLFPLIGLPSWF